MLRANGYLRQLKLNAILFAVFIIPQRWVMAIMGFLAVANAYTMRVCLNIAITQMVRRHAHSSGVDDGSCPADVDVVASDTTVSTF